MTQPTVTLPIDLALALVWREPQTIHFPIGVGENTTVYVVQGDRVYAIRVTDENYHPDMEQITISAGPLR